MRNSNIVASAKLLNGRTIVISRNDGDSHIDYRHLTEKEESTGKIEPMGNYQWHQSPIKRKWSDGIFSRFVMIDNTLIKVNQLFVQEFQKEMMDNFKWETRKRYRK